MAVMATEMMCWPCRSLYNIDISYSIIEKTKFCSFPMYSSTNMAINHVNVIVFIELDKFPSIALPI